MTDEKKLNFDSCDINSLPKDHPFRKGRFRKLLEILVIPPNNRTIIENKYIQHHTNNPKNNFSDN